MSNMPDKELISLICKDILKLSEKRLKNTIKHEPKPIVHRKDTKIPPTYNKKNVN